MTTVVQKPLPDREDLDNGAFWKGTDESRLLVKHCAGCSKHHWPPRLGCPHCGSDKVEWTAVDPKGEVFSWVVVHRSQTPGFDVDLPYAVLLVILPAAKGVRMVGNLVNGKPDALKAGMPVTAVFTPSPDGSVKLVNWQPA
jgi:uncharacterized OB-fold protein